MKLDNIDILITNFLLSIGLFGYIVSCFCIVIESIIPILPLSVFITLLFYKLGPVLGFIISYIFTIIGCIISYTIFNSNIRLKLEKYILRKDRKQLDKILKRIKRIRLSRLSLIIAIPFTPAFLVNIAAGLSNLDKKKYILSLMIGKVFLVIFWGFIGTSLINSFKNPTNLIYISLMLLACFIISKIVEKKEGLV